MKKAMGKRLHRGNLFREYPRLGRRLSHKDLGGQPLLQRDFGREQNCTLTALAFLFGAECYGRILEIALHYRYRREHGGTDPFRIRAIMRDCCASFGTDGVCRVAYGKGIGYDFRKIREILEDGRYLLLNLLGDGRRYYRGHTVTVIGYEEYAHGRFLLVYDHWNTSCSYIDYRRLCVISSINWLA